MRGLSNISDPLQYLKKDERIGRVLDQLLRFAASDLACRIPVSGKGDEVDAIIAGLNTLGEEMDHRLRQERERYDTERVNTLLHAMLNYTQLDFSQRATLSGRGDEIDALAAGLNVLVEEIQFLMNARKTYTEELEHVNRLLRLNEERTRLVTAEVRDYAIFTLSPQGMVMSWNRGAERIKGYTEEEIIGKHFSVFYTEEAKGNNYPQHELDMAKKEGRFEDEGWRVRKNGSLFWANAVITALKAEGQLIGYSKITRDLTKRKELEDSLTESNRQLVAANKELESFTYTVSHDLRAPVRAVHGFAQLLREEYNDKLNEDGQHLLDTMLNNSAQMGTLIDSLLEFSRLGRRELSRVRVDMKQAAETVIRQTNEYMPNRAKITVHPMGEVTGDPTLITQVLSNLLANAIKYSAKKQNPEIEIGRAQTEKGEAFYVKDNGAGFDMRFYDKLFGVFQRLHQQEEFEGTGVGLAIVHRIITRHGGEVWAEGEPEKGATFYFTLKN